MIRVRVKVRVRVMVMSSNCLVTTVTISSYIDSNRLKNWSDEVVDKLSDNRHLFGQCYHLYHPYQL